MTNIIQYRQVSTDIAPLDQLEAEVGKFITMAERQVHRLEWRDDEHGDKVQVRVACGSALSPLLRCDEVPAPLWTELLRPCSFEVLAKCLFELSVHKPWTRGAEAWPVLIKDVAGDLLGVSAFAVYKSCQHFRQKPDMQFFPDTAKLICHAKSIDFELRKLQAIQSVQQAASAPTNSDVEPKPKRTFRQTRRVGTLMRIARKPQSVWTSWEAVFVRAYGRHALGV